MGNNETFSILDLRSAQGKDSSLYPKHEVFQLFEQNRTGPVYIDSNQWSGWFFNGDYTATADVRATLWGLAELVTGDGNNWTKIDGYSGDPKKMPIGQVVNYQRLTKEIDMEILIVEGSSHTEAKIEEHIKKAIKILNPQQVAVSFKYSIKCIKDKSTKGFNLLDITELSLGDTPNDEAYNKGKMQGIGKGINATTGEELDLFDLSGKIFIQIYTRGLRDVNQSASNTNTLGFGFYQIPTALLSAGLVDTTVAHETCHNFGLLHENNEPDNLMYPDGSNRVNSDLTLIQVGKIKGYLTNYPNPFTL